MPGIYSIPQTLTAMEMRAMMRTIVNRMYLV